MLNQRLVSWKNTFISFEYQTKLTSSRDEGHVLTEGKGRLQADTVALMKR